MDHRFSGVYIDTGEATIFVTQTGSGPPLLLLHGFPQTHVMWRQLAPHLASDFTVVMADLRGYGASSCPPSAQNHHPYAKRAMARDMVIVMRQLGFEQFSVIGHDRGGRVAYRLALDYPEAIQKLAVFDVVPTDTVWDKADMRMALGFWPWSLLAQPSPLPELVLTTLAKDIVDAACDNWGTPANTFPKNIRQLYSKALQNPGHAHAICEEYRAAATLDRQHDLQSRQESQIISCPVLALWSTDGAVDTWYAEEGGPLAIWRKIAPQTTGQALAGGHFFPEANPIETYKKLHTFLS